MIPGASLVWKNQARILGGLEKIEKTRKKAAETATKVEGFRLRGKLKEEVLSARPGGTRLKPLSQLARRTKTGKLRKFARKPLAPLGRLVRYKATRGASGFNVAVGFVGGKMTSGGWKAFVMKHQEGGRFQGKKTRSELGRYFAKIGGKLAKKGDPGAKFFFLRKGTNVPGSFPARPEIDPFWNANKAKARSNITRNWERKMAGERI